MACLLSFVFPQSLLRMKRKLTRHGGKKMETRQIKEEFKQILADVMQDGVSPDEAHNSARIILQESGRIEGQRC